MTSFRIISNEREKRPRNSKIGQKKEQGEEVESFQCDRLGRIVAITRLGGASSKGCEFVGAGRRGGLDSEST